MTINTSSDIYLTAIDLSKGTEIRKFYNFFKSSLKWSEKEIRAYQISQVQKIVTHAFNYVPFYRKLFEKNNLTPSIIKNLDDLRRIPPLKREDIQEYFDELISINININKCYRGSSSGSTGRPVMYLQDKTASSAGRAAGYIGWHITGWNFNQKGLHIWGNPNAVNVQWKRLSSRIKSKLFNVTRYPAYQLTDKNKFDELVSLIKNVKFDYIDGYTNAIYLLSKYIAHNNIKLNKAERILTTGENMHDYQKEAIEASLGKVYDCYGCGEINGIAYQNQVNDDYTIIDPNVIIEFDDSSDYGGGVQDLIITHLHNYAMPFIRYKNGDAAIPSNIREGTIKFSRLKRITGRVSDIITLPKGGALVVPSFFGSKLLRLVNCITQYQVVKINSNKIIIKLATNSALNNDSKVIIHDAVNNYIGNSIEWVIEYVKSIQPSKSGKFKLVLDLTNEKSTNS